MLEEALPNHYNDLVAASERLHPSDTRPRAWGFYDYFREILGDARTRRKTATGKYSNPSMKVQKGDIVVARYADEWRAEQIAAGKERAAPGT